MTVLQRTGLTTSQKIQCAAAAVSGQHAHGSKTALSETYEISRPTVYAVGAAAQSVLRSHFEAPLLQGAAVDVRVDDAQLRRAVVALRVLAPNAIRPIEDLVPLVYPGVKVSYGTIQQMLVEAEGRAARFNAQVSLGGVEAGALDELFSQGEPVLAGVDLDSGYLFGLSLSPTRDGEAWAELLGEGQAQGLELSVVVKDWQEAMVADDLEEVRPPGTLGIFPASLVADRFQGALERVVGVRDGVLRTASAVAGVGAQEFLPRSLEASLVKVSQCWTYDLGMDQLRIHPEDLPVLELIPDPGTPEPLVELVDRVVCGTPYIEFDPIDWIHVPSATASWIASQAPQFLSPMASLQMWTI